MHSLTKSTTHPLKIHTSFFTLFQFLEALLTGHDFELLVNENDRPGFRNFLTLVFSTGTTQSTELGLDRIGRSPLRIQVRAVHSQNGDECLAIVLDITDLWQAESTAKQLAAIVESSEDAIIGKDLNGIVTNWNRSAQRIFGYTAAEMVGASDLRLLPADSRHEEDQLLGKIKLGENLAPIQTLRTTKTGLSINVSLSFSPIKDATGKLIGISQIARNVTKQAEHEREIARLNRLYAALSQVSQAIVWLPSRDELFRKVCQVLVEEGGFSMVWIGWYAPESQTIIAVAECGAESGYLQSIKVYADNRPEGCGPTGTAFRENRTYVCNDMFNDPATLPWRSDVTRCGWRASAAFPIRSGGKVCGTLSVYADEPGIFKDKEVSLLEEAAVDISFALENFRREEEGQQAQQIVKSERDFSNAVINSLPGVLYLYDGQGRFLRWNKNFGRVTGYTESEIKEMHPLDFFEANDRERVAARITEVFQKGESHVEARFVSKDGRMTPYYFTGITTQIDGQTCLVGVGIDISERQRAEAAQAASEARYRTLFEYAPDGILIANDQGIYVDANDSVCLMLGYERNQLVGLSGNGIVVPKETQNVEPALNAINSGAAYHQEWQLQRKDGSVFPAEVIVTKMPDGNLLAMIRDITQRKQAELAMRVLNQTLELEVQERTGELQTALVRAESADRLKSSFLATMSHELRTPLNSIIGFTGIILQGLAGPLTDEQTKQLGMVRGSARHLLDLIKDVLDISKIEAGQLEVRSDVFDLPASIERVVASVQPLAEKKGLRLTAMLSPSLSVMVSDRRRVEQILLNLLNNAIKFTDQGVVTLTADMIPDFQSVPNSQPQPAVRFTFSDTGIGIKPEDLATLFQPFRQVDTGIARQHEGTGLGLAICRRLANLMGGEISAASEYLVGSTFTATLPLEKAASP